MAPDAGPVYKDKREVRNYRVLSASMLTDVADHTANQSVTLQKDVLDTEPIACNGHKSKFETNGRTLERSESAERK